MVTTSIFIVIHPIMKKTNSEIETFSSMSDVIVRCLKNKSHKSFCQEVHHPHHQKKNIFDRQNHEKIIGDKNQKELDTVE